MKNKEAKLSVEEIAAKEAKEWLKAFAKQSENKKPKASTFKSHFDDKPRRQAWRLH